MARGYQEKEKTLSLQRAKEIVEKNWAGIKVMDVSDFSNKGFFNEGLFKLITEDGRGLALKGYGDKFRVVSFLDKARKFLLTNNFNNLAEVKTTNSGLDYYCDQNNYYVLSGWIEGPSLAEVD